MVLRAPGSRHALSVKGSVCLRLRATPPRTKSALVRHAGRKQSWAPGYRWLRPARNDATTRARLYESLETPREHYSGSRSRPEPPASLECGGRAATVRWVIHQREAAVARAGLIVEAALVYWRSALACAGDALVPEIHSARTPRTAPWVPPQRRREPRLEREPRTARVRPTAPRLFLFFVVVVSLFGRIPKSIPFVTSEYFFTPFHC